MKNRIQSQLPKNPICNAEGGKSPLFCNLLLRKPKNRIFQWEGTYPDHPVNFRADKRLKDVLKG